MRSCGMRCSIDWRQRVVEFIRSGGSKAEAARRFKVGEASVYRWLTPGGLTYQRPGPASWIGNSYAVMWKPIPIARKRNGRGSSTSPATVSGTRCASWG